MFARLTLALLLIVSPVALADDGSGSDGSGSAVVVIPPPPADVPVDAGSAVAPVEPSPIDDDPMGFLESTYKAIKTGEWWHVTAFGLIGVVWLGRQKWALGRVPWFMTDRGGVALAFGLAFMGSFAHAALAGVGFPGLEAMKAAFLTAVAAIGGYVGAKRLLWPSDKK